MMPCCNADGSKNRVGGYWKAQKASRFQRQNSSRAGLGLLPQQRKWMTIVLLFDWLRRFDAYLGRTRGRKAVLLMDNCSEHGDQHSLSELQNAELIFLPLNRTSKIQPMDAGIISEMKGRYRKLQLERVLDLTDEYVWVGCGTTVE